MTNYEKIKNMSPEEMSDFLMDWAIKLVCGSAPVNVQAWLESEAEKND